MQLLFEIQYTLRKVVNGFGIVLVRSPAKKNTRIGREIVLRDLPLEILHSGHKRRGNYRSFGKDTIIAQHRIQRHHTSEAVSPYRRTFTERIGAEIAVNKAFEVVDYPRNRTVPASINVAVNITINMMTPLKNQNEISR